MARRRGLPSQGWKTFLRNHADGIAAMDLFVVPTISFSLLYGLLILRHDRRRIVWIGATAHPTADWIARQLVEACGWSRPHDTSSVIETVLMAKYSSGVSARWAYEIDRHRRDHHGKTDIRDG
jgi:hypothetical protein